MDVPLGISTPESGVLMMSEILQGMSVQEYWPGCFGEHLGEDWRIGSSRSSIYRGCWAPESATIYWLLLKSADVHVVPRYDVTK